MMQAAFFQHASVAGTTRFSSCRRKFHVSIFLLRRRREEEEEESGGIEITRSRSPRSGLRRSVRTGKRGRWWFDYRRGSFGEIFIHRKNFKLLGVSGSCRRDVERVLSEKLPCIVGMLATSTVLPHLGLSHLLPAGGFELIEGTSRLALALFLVGFGSKLGGGCLAGTGSLGLVGSRPRSIVNVCTFMIFGALAATMFNTNALLHVVTETGKGKRSRR